MNRNTKKPEGGEPSGFFVLASRINMRDCRHGKYSSGGGINFQESGSEKARYFRPGVLRRIAFI
jgi:hypothetical protein